MKTKCSIIFLFILISLNPVSAQKTTTREFVKDGTTYIEETEVSKDGSTSVITYEKPVNEVIEVKTTTEVKKLQNGGMVLKSNASGEGINVNTHLEYSKKEIDDIKKHSADYLQALLDCKPFKKSYNVPLFDKVMIKMDREVHGLVNGKCKVTQTQPENNILTCFYNEAQRKEIFENPITDAKIQEDETTCKFN
jgi:hypothetical protein